MNAILKRYFYEFEKLGSEPDVSPQNKQLESDEN
jgi:hypothetical protein